MEPEPKRRQLIPVVFEKNDASSSEMCESTESEETCYACIISEQENAELEKALKTQGMSVCYSTDGHHLPKEIPDECNMTFICEKFEGKVFDYLKQKGFRILGPPCVLACALQPKELPVNTRPTFCCTMCDVVVCFTGFKDKDHLHRLCNFVHLMGGSIRKEMVNSVTHVVANTVFGSKYKAAVFLNTPIMREEWIHACWEKRMDINCNVSLPDLLSYKQLPFAGCKIALFGFKEEEELDMVGTAQKNGADCVSVGSSGLTHLVVSDNAEPDSIPVTSSRVKVVKQQWFWESIQIDACTDETLYPVNSAVVPVRRKRKRQSAAGRSILSTVLESSLMSSFSPVGDESVSFMEVDDKTEEEGQHQQQQQHPKHDPRYYIADELLQTEKNYVSILTTIVKVFKEPLECPTLRGGPILSPEDVKGIFGNVADILDVHKNIQESLEERVSSWSEQSCIGSVFNDQANKILKVYPPFVNFFEMSKETLHRCDKQYPRFHAFLKASESKAECHRQSLEELLITPIQRIPRIILLLQDLLKHTTEVHPDHNTLMKVVEVIKSTLVNINEDKRKTEKQMLLFEVVKEIEDCPANILSSNRRFIKKFDAIDIGADPSNRTSKGELITMFLFSDSIEMAKRRGTLAFKGSNKTYKHIELMSFQHIRSVVNFIQDKSGSDLFGFLVHYPEDVQEKLLVFQLASSEKAVIKEDLLTELSGLIAELNSSSNTAQFLVTASSDVLFATPGTPGKSETGPSSGGSIKLKKAIHGARKRVQRAFSHRKKPLAPSLQLNQNDSFSTLGTDDSTVEVLDLSTSYMFTSVTPVTALTALSKKHLTLNSRQKEQTPPVVSSYNTAV